MKIESPTIKTVVAYTSTLIVGQLAQYKVKWLESQPLYFQKFISYLTVIGTNILFFEVAISICHLVHRLFNHYEDDYEQLSTQERYKRSLVLGLLFISIMGGANWGISKILHLPISRWKMGIVSFFTCSIYLYCKSE